MKLSKKKRTLLAIYIGWVCLHFIFWMISTGYRSYYFWPFGHAEYGNLKDAYDGSEFFTYSIVPVAIYGIYLLIRKDAK